MEKGSHYRIMPHNSQFAQAGNELYRSCPDNSRGCLMSFFMLLLIAMPFYGVITAGDWESLWALLLWSPVLLILLDEVLWGVSGEESAVLDGKYLIVYRAHRIFKRRKRIALSKIVSIQPYESSAIHTLVSWGLPTQYTLSLSCTNRLFQYKFGEGLSNSEREEVIRLVVEAVKRDAASTQEWQEEKPFDS